MTHTLKTNSGVSNMQDERKNGNGKGFGFVMEWFRVITPVLLGLTLFILSGLRGDIANLELKVDKVDAKIFSHLSNHDIHIPRDCVVWRETFELHKEYLESERNRTLATLKELTEAVRSKR